jgi:hypothetical protein
MSPAELVANGFRDVVSPFIKDEPHPPRKVATESWRIVQCVSMIDQLVERVLYSRPVLAIKRSYPTSSAVVGIGFTDDDTELFHAEARAALGPDLVPTDIKGWDRALGSRYVTESGESIIRSADRPCAAWENAVRNHVYGLINPVFIVEHKGHHILLIRPVEGGMLSGSYMTTTFNTLSRLDVSSTAGALKAKAAGDDALEVFPEEFDYKAAYESIGFEIRESANAQEGTFEFCSHEYTDPTVSRPDAPRRSKLTSWLKVTLRYFLNAKVSSEQYHAVLHELRHNPELEILKPFFKARYESCKTDSGVESEQKL